MDPGIRLRAAVKKHRSFRQRLDGGGYRWFAVLNDETFFADSRRGAQPQLLPGEKVWLEGGSFPHTVVSVAYPEEGYEATGSVVLDPPIPAWPAQSRRFSP